MANAVNTTAYNPVKNTVISGRVEKTDTGRRHLHNVNDVRDFRVKNPDIGDLRHREMKIGNLPGEAVRQFKSIENKNRFYQNLSDLPNDLSKYFDKNTTPEMQKQLRFKHYQPVVDEHPYISREILKLGSNTLQNENINKIFNARPAAQLLGKAVNFENSNTYITNTIIVDSHKNVELFSDFIKDKLISQNMDPARTPGIIYNFESDLSKDIAKSKEIRDFIKKYSVALNNQQLISTSINFSSTQNLYWAINNADILFAYYDNNRNLILVILDTYDFNENDTNFLVRLGYSAQEANLLTGFFSLIFVLVPAQKKIILLSILW